MNEKEKAGVRNFVAQKIERPGKTLEELQAEADAFNKEQLELAQKND